MPGIPERAHRAIAKGDFEGDRAGELERER